MRKRYPTRRGWRSENCGEQLRCRYGGQFAGSGQGFVVNGSGVNMAESLPGAVREPRQTVPGTKLVWAGIKV